MDSRERVPEIQRANFAMTDYYCNRCDTIVDGEHWTGVEVFDNRHDRPATVETVSRLCCELCGDDVDECISCNACANAVADSEWDLCAKCLALYWYEHPSEHADTKIEGDIQSEADALLRGFWASIEAEQEAGAMS